MKINDPAEAMRLLTLRELDVLDTPGESRFDRITRMAREILQVPMAVLEFVDEGRVWVKSSQGLAESESPRMDSFADAAIRGTGALLVTDARYDERFRSHPRVSGNGGVRFYAGHPVIVKGEKVGVLGVMGSHPRRLSLGQAQVLADLAALAEREVLVRRWSGGQEQLVASRAGGERRSVLDPASGLWNRQGMEEILESETGRAALSGGSLGMILVSLETSRPSGTLLRETAERLRGALRPADVLGRWDEGTCLLLLPGWDAGTTERVAHHLLAAAVPDTRSPAREPFLRMGVTAAEAGRTLAPNDLLSLAAEALEDTRGPGRRGIAVRRPRRESAVFAGLQLAVA